ncbi:alpha/beta hydrolase [Hyphococcus sp.]|uniref:alpha/beta hydrolase n=1 Tax=Hyphococcus sp. TaxID=2038636 RepID=UPI00207F27B0|nr:MAG: hydrolase [Marinicaulis sp.]
MPSIRAVLFNWYMKSAFKSKPIHLIPAHILTEGAEKLAPDAPPHGVSLESVDESAVKGEWHRADDASGSTVMYLHGGGYVFGSPKSHRAFTFTLAKEAGTEVFSLDYRLAPEHLFPAAVDDALAAYQWLLKAGCDPARMVVGGDSAGGGLTLALLLSIKARGLPMPAGVLLLSPWTDLATTGASLDRNEKSDAMFKKVYITEGAKRYLGTADAKAPLASPLYGDLGGLPPMLTFVSNSEVLCDDSLRLHDRLLLAGVDSTLIAEDGLIHVWPIFPGRFPEAKESIKQAAAFIRQRTQQG